jgi:3-phenylpropionate/cinnamic acid dioxygenase small subunit
VEEDDDSMSADLHQIAEFLWLEADLLDQKDYAGWLDLWDDDGLYIVPVNRNNDDFENQLNYAYDNQAMRRMRVKRLTSGESVSASAAGITVRTVSRFRRLADSDDGTIQVRCAQYLTEFRAGKFRPYVADVTFALRPEGNGWRIVKKIVLLVNSTEALAGMTFLP